MLKALMELIFGKYDHEGRAEKARGILADWRCMRKPWIKATKFSAVKAALAVDPASARLIVGFLFNKKVVRIDKPSELEL